MQLWQYPDSTVHYFKDTELPTCILNMPVVLGNGKSQDIESNPCLWSANPDLPLCLGIKNIKNMYGRSTALLMRRLPKGIGTGKPL